MVQRRILSLNIGMPLKMEYQGKELETGIYKEATEEELFLSFTNLRGDGQADLRYHGGKDKAICVYPFEHYAYWENQLNRPLSFGAFSENFTSLGLLEPEVCIGDIFAVGSSILQVSQPRQPCHKLAKKFNVTDLAVQVQGTGFTGFYFRVLQEGFVNKTDLVILKERNEHQITIQFANQLMHHDKENQNGIQKILAVQGLSNSWFHTLSKRLEGHDHDTTPRMFGD